MFPQVQGPRWCVCAAIVKVGVKLIQMTCESLGRQEMGSTNFHEVGRTWPKRVLVTPLTFYQFQDPTEMGVEPGSILELLWLRLCPDLKCLQVPLLFSPC